MRDSDQEDFKGTERFRIERRLGEGGFGVVYQAFDRKRNAQVALKLLRRFDVAALYRFKQEFRSLADVNHDNLVTLYELISSQGNWFFTMELIDGVNLLEYVRGVPRFRAPVFPSDVTTLTMDPAWAPVETRPAELAPDWTPLRVDRLRSAFTQLATGLCALHSAGMLHRDIKPSNVMVTGEGRVVLLDFGLVANIGPEDATPSVDLVGTPLYMSPEQAAGRPVSEGSDWYGVGVLLYETLTGSLPFAGRMLDILTNKQELDPPPPIERAPGIPTDVDALCRALLRRDPQLRPSGREVMDRLVGLPAEMRPPILVRSPPLRGGLFVGRERHLAALMQAFEATKHGSAVTLCVQGRSGMGKTVLVRRFLEDLRHRERHVVILAGRCYERESVPYKGLDSLVDAVTRYLKHLPEAEVEAILPRDVLALARLFPVLREVKAVIGSRRKMLAIPDSQELRRRSFAALRELLARLSDHSPVVLFIDDLQWGDLDSVALLAELLRPPDPPTLLLITCYRSEEAASPLLRAFLQSIAAPGAVGDVRELEVGELTSSEARQLAIELLGGSQPGLMERAEAIARESGGSPFFVDELARYIPDGQAKAQASLDEVIHDRVLRLPGSARRLLEVIAVAGQPVDVEVTKKAAELGGDEQAMIGALRTARLVRSVGSPDLDEIEPFHDRIRETVIAHLTAEGLKSHHDHLARAWEASGRADAETLAVHFQGADDSQKATRYAVQAAEEAAEALAFDRAARLYRLALELRPSEESERRALLRKLPDALANAGRGAEAGHAYLAAAEGAGTVEALDLKRRAAEQLLISGHVDEGLGVLRSVLGMVGMKLAETPRRALFALLIRRAQLRLRGLRFRERPASQLSADEIAHIDTCWSVAIGLGLNDTIRGNHFQVRHLLLALRAGEPYRVARALAMEVGYSAVPGGPTRRRTEGLMEATMALAERVNHPHALGLAAVMAGCAELLVGRFRKCFEMEERALPILREHCTGVAWEIDAAEMFALFGLVWLGEWNRVILRVPVILKEAQERGDLFLVTSIRTRFLYGVYLAADDPERARAEQSPAIEAWSQQGFHLQHYWDLLARVETNLYSGDPLAAWNHTAERWPALANSVLLHMQYGRIESRNLRARAALASAALCAESRRQGQAEDFLREAERDARSLEREKMDWANALARLVRAAVAASRGDRPTAVALLTSAERELQAVDVGHYTAACRRRRGELLGGDEGKALVEGADAWMAAQNIRNPGRFAAMLSPGRWC